MTIDSPVIGIVGAGVISSEYLSNLTRMPGLRIEWVSDRNADRARSVADSFGIPRSGTYAEMLRDPQVDIVVNLTRPDSHVDIGLQAIASGKHVWSEKPLALDRGSGKILLDAASAAGLRVACAPDTILSPGFQTARRIVESNTIGSPLTGLALFHIAGPELWHPNPEFLFEPGGGPLYDIGPYYLGHLLEIFGAVRSVSAVSSTASRSRVIGSGPREGTRFDVHAPTHTAALLSFADGGVAQLSLSFDSARTRAGILEVTGALGTVVFPDPNDFMGATEIWRPGAAIPEIVRPQGHDLSRGIGVWDLAEALRNRRVERAGADKALHVVDVMDSITEAALSGLTVSVQSTFTSAPALPTGWNPLDPTPDTTPRTPHAH